jgi:hypothetical protein
MSLSIPRQQSNNQSKPNGSNSTSSSASKMSESLSSSPNPFFNNNKETTNNNNNSNQYVQQRSLYSNFQFNSDTGTPPAPSSISFAFKQTPKIIENSDQENRNSLLPHRRNSCLIERQISYNTSRRRSSQLNPSIANFLNSSQGSNTLNKSADSQSLNQQLQTSNNSNTNKQTQKTLDSIYDVYNYDCKCI